MCHILALLQKKNLTACQVSKMSYLDAVSMFLKRMFKQRTVYVQHAPQWSACVCFIGCLGRDMPLLNGIQCTAGFKQPLNSNSF